MRKEKYVLLFFLVVIACVVTASLLRNGARGQEGAAAEDTEEKVASILADMEEDGEAVWRCGRRLENLGVGAVPALLATWDKLPARKQVAAGWALSRLGRRVEVLEWALTRMEEEKETEVRILLADLLRTAAVRKDSGRLETLLDGVFEPRVKVPLCKALWESSKNLRAKKELKSLLDSEDEQVRIDAAMALAELGDVEPGKRILRRLAEEPTARGRLARSLLREHTLNRMLERAAFQSDPEVAKRFDDPVLEEVRDRIENFYVDDSKKGFARLAEEAASGIVNLLDPFSAYIRMETMKRLRQIRSGGLVGVGLALGFDTKSPEGEAIQRIPVVVAPVWNGAASLAGVQALDQVWEVDGKSVLGKSLAELTCLIAGEPGSRVTLTLFHRGWFRERKVTLRRGKTEVAEILTEKLPAGLLLVKIPRMSDGVGPALRKTLEGALASETRGVILDLRDNPGGSIPAAAKTAGAFLPKATPVCTVAGRTAEAFTPETYETDAEGDLKLPLVTLVNRGTADAAEVLAGALRDAGRCTLVGEGTFGAGSVQRQFPLETTEGKTALRLTVATVTLPKTGAFHGKGLLPDRRVESRRLEIWRHDEIAKVLEKGFVEKYLDERFEKHAELFRELARFDGGKTDRYPDFRSWFLSTATRAEEDDLRGLLRASIRRRLSAKEGTPFITDLQEDKQIRAAIRVLAKALNIDLAKIPEYAPFADEKD
ncbi:MAG: S41 family peptidase [Planctomycetota bacterium]|jgi:carboxyl-terminal processing protease